MNERKRLKMRLIFVVYVLVCCQSASGMVGKIRGWVTDAETGDPLTGTHIYIKEYKLGTATDKKGEYIILNVPAGKITLEASHMGYRKIEIEEVIINSGLTTFRDVCLSKTVIQGEPITIVAERSLIDNNETNEIHSVQGEDLARKPIRGVDAVLTSFGGVISDHGAIHVRGGRSDETGYYLDNMNVTKPTADDPAREGLGVSIIDNAIEEVQFQTGGFSAEYGGKMSGVTLTTMKTGSPKYILTGECISDDFWAIKNKAGSDQVLGINRLYSFGYNDYILTASGPVHRREKNIRFFIAGQSYNRQSDATWFEGFRQDSNPMAYRWYKTDGTVVEDSMDLSLNAPAGRLPGGGKSGLVINGNVVWDRKPFRIKLGWNWASEKEQAQASNPLDLLAIPQRGEKTISGNMSAYFNLTHAINPTTFYGLSGSYFKSSYETGDPIWWRDWKKYGDPNLNPALLDTSVIRECPSPFDENVSMDYPGTPVRDYAKSEQERIGVRFDFTKQFDKRHEVKIGGEADLSVIRYFSFQARDLLRRLGQVERNPGQYTEYDVYSALSVQMIGYDWHGNKVNQDQESWTLEGLPDSTSINLRNRPIQPLVVGVYIQDRIELRDLIVNAGVRFDYMTNGFPSLANLDSLAPGPGNTIGDKYWRKERTYTTVSPRLGFSFPVTDRAAFHASFSRFVQPPNPYQVWAYHGYTNFIHSLYGNGYLDILSNPNLKPERTTSYEFGTQIQFGHCASLDVTLFYKDTRDLLTLRTLFSRTVAYHSPVFVMNGDFGTIKGMTATFYLKRTSRVQSQINYTLSYARGTGSRTDEHRDIAWQENKPMFPKVISALEYDIRHKGTIMVDVRTLPQDGPSILGVRPIGNVGLSLKFDFQSGTPYTRIPAGDAYSSVFGYSAAPPLEAPNSSTLPWVFQLDGKLDRTFHLGSVKLNVYLWAINILGGRSFTEAYSQTGRNDSDGWLKTTSGKQYAQEKGPEAVRWYQAILTQCGSLWYQKPRQLRLGLKFEI